MEEFLKKYNEYVDFYAKNHNSQVKFNQRYKVYDFHPTKLMIQKIKENIPLKELVCYINKVLLLTSKVYNSNGIVMNIFDIIPPTILEPLINDYPSFNTYINFYILNGNENKKFFEKVVQFENEKSIYLSLDYIDVSIDFNIYKDLVTKISKFENAKLINKTFCKKNVVHVIKRVLKNLKTKEIDEFYNSCSNNFIESISQNLYFINILPKNLIKEYISEIPNQKNNENISRSKFNKKSGIIVKKIDTPEIAITKSSENINHKNNIPSNDNEHYSLEKETDNTKIISKSNENIIYKNTKESNKITFDETKIMVQNIFDEKFKTLFNSFSDVKEILNFLKTYTFLKIDKESIDCSMIEDYIELFKYIDVKNNF